MKYNYDYFISYAHKDNVSENGKPGFVDEFVEKLKNSPEHQQMFGEEVKVFFDKSEIHSMSDWDNRIRSSLASSRFFVVLLSPNYFQSEYCAREFDWWMQHEMHRRVLGEGTAPMLIVSVNDLYDFNVNPLPEIPQDIQVKFPNWVKQIRQIQSGPDFDMHDLDRFKIDEILRSLCENTKDKYFKQVIAEDSPINAGYPQYNENFVGRRENLRSLRQTLSTSCTTAISAVNGLGGIGKTELALTYGHAFAWDYELGRVFANCENSDSLEDVILSSSIAEMHGVELKGTNEQQLTTLYNTLKNKIMHIEQRNKEKGIDRTLGTHVLLILDNVNRLELISQRNLDKLPDFFHVIITTREDANKFPHIHTENVERLSEDESVELLSNLREFGDDPQEAVAAREIAKLLDGFTLAVELTGAYLKKSPRVTYQKQFERLNANISDAMETMADKTQTLRRHQAECISVVLKSSLSALSDNARNALEFAALMPPDAVGFGWLPELLGLEEDEGWEVLDELTGYNLLTPLGGEPNIARIHRLVAETVKQETPKDVQKEIIAKIREKCDALLDKDETFWFTSENSWNIMPISELCLALVEQWTVETSEEEIDWNLTWMFGASGKMLILLGKMNEARKMLLRCLEICEERIKAFPESADAQRYLSLTYYLLGFFNKDAGNVDSERDCYKKLLEIRKRQLEKTPDNIDALRDLSISYNDLGDMENAAGNAAAAREWYEKAIEIAQRLVDLMSDNVEAQQDLSVSYEELGKLELAAGNVAAARDWCEKALEIRKRLAEQAPDNIDAQRNLSASYDSLGDLEKAAGNATAALEWYEKAMEILKRLAKIIPDDVNAQRSLSISYTSLGFMEQTAGNVASAREWYMNALEINKRLADLMPENVLVQRRLSISYNYLGDLEEAAGNAAVAWGWYEKAMEIRKLLAEQIPDNVEIQKNLSDSYKYLGDLEKAAGNIAAAREWYEKALEIALQLAEKMPDNVQAQQDLSFSYERLGYLEKAAGNVATAREWYDKCMEIRKRLVDKMPDNDDAQWNLSVLYNNLGDLEREAGNAASAREWYDKCIKIRERLAEKMPDNDDTQWNLSVLYNDLGDLEREAGYVASAQEWYDKCLEIRERLAEKMPEDVNTQRNLGQSYIVNGCYELLAKNFAAAWERFEKALVIFKRLADLEPDNVQVQEDLASTQKLLAKLQNLL